MLTGHNWDCNSAGVTSTPCVPRHWYTAEENYGDSHWLIGLLFRTQSPLSLATNSSQSDRTWLYNRPLSHCSPWALSFLNPCCVLKVCVIGVIIDRHSPQSPFFLFFFIKMTQRAMNTSYRQHTRFTQREINTHVQCLACTFCTNAHKDMCTRQQMALTNHPLQQTHTHTSTHTNTLLGETTEHPIHFFCARRLLCPRASVRSILLSSAA